MAIQQVNLGATGTGAGGDSARTAFEKLNANFSNPAHAANRLAQTSATDTTADALMAVGAGGWLGQAALDSYIAGFPTAVANNITQVYRRETQTADDLPPYSARFHFAAEDTWGRLVVSHRSDRAYVQGGTIAGGWTAELYHTGNISTASVAYAATAGSAKNALGVGQTWQNVTASRALGTTYTNTTGRPIQILVQYCDSGVYGGAIFNIGGLSRKTGDIGSSSHSPFWFSAVVPNGVTYSISGAVILPAWWELR